MIKAILFDVFGTVVDWRSSLIADLAGWGRAQGVAADWAGLVDAWRAAYIPSMDSVRGGVWVNFDALHLVSLKRLAPRFGLSDLSAAQWDHINKGWRRLKPWPDSVPGLQQLKAHGIVAPRSNGNVAMLEDMAQFGRLPWDRIFGADLFQHYKPDREVYLGACELLGLAPGQVMMVAAHNYDLQGARACGLRTAFIARPTEYGPGQTSDLVPESDWDRVAPDILALASQLSI